MSIATLADSGLPFNRKERYFTGTLFPMLVCAHDFAHFHRLTELCGLGPITIDARPANANIQIFTEYGFSESLVGSARDRFPGAVTTKETPDVMVYVGGASPALLAVEAKMYDCPSAAELQAQMDIQAALTAFIAERLAVPPSRVSHVALLPEKLARRMGRLPYRIVTWEQLGDTFADVAPPYFVETLRVALERYDTLKSPRTAAFGENADGTLTGAELHDRHRSGTLTPCWMGRRGGLHGPELTADLRTGAWRVRRYEHSSTPVGNPNWFTVAEFVAKVEAFQGPRGGG